MLGFKDFIESYTDFVQFSSEDPHGPSIYEAMYDIFDYKKALKAIDLILGASKMILMLKPTARANLDVLAKIYEILRSPSDKNTWLKLGKALGESGKLTAANPLVLFPVISPLISELPASKQAILYSLVKFLSSTYFYLTQIADQNADNEKLQKLISTIKPLLPDTNYGQRNT